MTPEYILRCCECGNIVFELHSHDDTTRNECGNCQSDDVQVIIGTIIDEQNESLEKIVVDTIKKLKY